MELYLAAALSLAAPFFASVWTLLSANQQDQPSWYPPLLAVFITTGITSALILRGLFLARKCVSLIAPMLTMVGLSVITIIAAMQSGAVTAYCLSLAHLAATSGLFVAGELAWFYLRINLCFSIAVWVSAITLQDGRLILHAVLMLVALFPSAPHTTVMEDQHWHINLMLNLTSFLSPLLVSGRELSLAVSRVVFGRRTSELERFAGLLLVGGAGCGLIIERYSPSAILAKRATCAIFLFGILILVIVEPSLSGDVFGDEVLTVHMEVRKAWALLLGCSGTTVLLLRLISPHGRWRNLSAIIEVGIAGAWGSYISYALLPSASPLMIHAAYTIIFASLSSALIARRKRWSGYPAALALFMITSFAAGWLQWSHITSISLDPGFVSNELLKQLGVLSALVGAGSACVGIIAAFSTTPDHYEGSTNSVIMLSFLSLSVASEALLINRVWLRDCALAASALPLMLVRPHKLVPRLDSSRRLAMGIGAVAFFLSATAMMHATDRWLTWMSGQHRPSSKYVLVSLKYRSLGTELPLWRQVILLASTQDVVFLLLSWPPLANYLSFLWNGAIPRNLLSVALWIFPEVATIIGSHSRNVRCMGLLAIGASVCHLQSIRSAKEQSEKCL